jgi:acyl-CoA thioester hydrolase
MIRNISQLRVLYADTDKMGFVYYGNYAKYIEYGRTETFRQLGITYRALEDAGIAMPVIDMKNTFIKAAHYDDLLSIETLIEKLPETRMHFLYHIFREKELIHEANTTLIFFDLIKNKPVKAPAILLNKMYPFFKQ